MCPSRDLQVKTMEQTVVHAEKHLGEICSLLASYTRKTAKLRDKADLLVARLFDFCRTEDPELQLGLKNLAEDLAMVQDYRQAELLIMWPTGELLSISPSILNGGQPTDLKKFNADLKREMKQLRQLEKIRLRDPADRQSIAEVNAQKASNNAQRSIRQLEETITDFQRQKLEDIKRIFTDFITVEMLFHAKALEVYTHTYQNLEAMDTEKDLQSRNTFQHQRAVEETPEQEEEDEEEEEEEDSGSETEDGQHTTRQSYAAQYAQMHRWQK
uniref:Family with sequence similarity 92 member B n=1 Tax=Stegastes partitus TaxID=144197 RepID=A0A3B4YU08_9TELE